MSVVIRATGSCVPEEKLSNADLESVVETSDDWIVARTGIRSRSVARSDEATSDLATRAAQSALEQAGLSSDDIDRTPDLLGQTHGHTGHGSYLQAPSSLGRFRGSCPVK